MNQPINDHELQRLVDGRLTGDERDTLVKCANDRPQCWRTIASAFIEEQILRDALCPESRTDQLALEPGRTVSKSRRKPVIFVQTIAVVLCLIVGVTIGRATMRQKTSTDDGASSLVVKSESTPGSYVMLVSLPIESSGSGDVARKSDSWEQLSTPLFDEAMRDIVRQHGYNLTEEAVIYMFDDTQGDRYVLPHRQVSLIANDE